MKYCKRPGCLNEAQPENYVRDTPLCEKCEEIVRAIVERGTRQVWYRGEAIVAEKVYVPAAE